MSDEDEFLIVALGASAGGLEPLETFFKHMLPDAGIAFVIVQHLAPDHPTSLPQLLARHTAMPVEQAQDNTQVMPNRVYVIPPNATLTIEKGVLRVAAPVAARGARTPIDSFFSSLAQDHGENAVCIMMSGTGTDGTLGLRAIKEHGGMAMAQTWIPPSMTPYSAAPSPQVLWIMCCRWKRCRHVRTLSVAATS
jgi:two-component system, chemotaxis family, CheB/CheR fusion protein